MTAVSSPQSVSAEQELLNIFKRESAALNASISQHFEPNHAEVDDMIAPAKEVFSEMDTLHPRDIFSAESFRRRSIRSGSQETRAQQFEKLFAEAPLMRDRLIAMEAYGERGIETEGGIGPVRFMKHIGNSGIVAGGRQVSGMFRSMGIFSTLIAKHFMDPRAEVDEPLQIDFADIESFDQIASQPGGPLDPANMLTFRFADAIDQKLFEMFPQEEALREDFMATKLPEALGSMFSFVILSYLTAGGGKAVGLSAQASRVTAGGLIGAASQAQDEFQEAIRQGKGLEAAFDIYMANLPVGATEGVTFDRVLDRMISGKGPMRQVLLAAAENAIQGGLARTGANFVAGRPATDGLTEEMILEAIGGGFASAMVMSGDKMRSVVTGEPTRLAIADALEEARTSDDAATLGEANVELEEAAMTLDEQVEQELAQAPRKPDPEQEQQVVEKDEVDEALESLNEEELAIAEETVHQIVAENPNLHETAQSNADAVLDAIAATKDSLARTSPGSGVSAAFQESVRRTLRQAQQARPADTTLDGGGAVGGAKKLGDIVAAETAASGDMKVAQRISQPAQILQRMINDLVFPITNPKTTLRKFFSAGVRQATRDVAQRIRDVKMAVRAEVRAELKAKQKANQARIDGLQKSLRDAIQAEARLPQAVRDRLKARLSARVKTTKSLQTQLDNLAQTVEKFEKRQALKDLRNTLKKLKKVKLLDRFDKKVSRLTENFTFFPLNDDTKAEIVRLRDFANENPDVLLPKKLTDQFDLVNEEGDALAKHFDAMETGEIVAMNTALRQVLAENALSKKLIAAQKARDRDKTIEAVAQEWEREDSPLTPRKKGKADRLEGRRRAGLLDVIFSRIEKWTPRSVARWLGGDDMYAFDADATSATSRILYKDVADGQAQVMADSMHGSRAIVEAVRQSGRDPATKSGSLVSPEFAKRVRDVTSIITLGRRGTVDTSAEVIEIQLSTPRPINRRKRRDGKTFRETTTEPLRLHPSELAGILAHLRDTETFELIVFGQTPLHLEGRNREDVFFITPDDVPVLRELAHRMKVDTIADFLVDDLNSHFSPRFRAWSMRHLGIDVSRPGTYWGRHRQLTGKQKAKRLSTPDLTNWRSRTIESLSLTKERTRDTKTPIEVRDVFRDYMEQVVANSMLVNLSDPIRTALTVLRSDRVQEILQKAKQGSRIQRKMERHYEALVAEAIGGGRDMGFYESVAVNAMRNIQVGILGRNIAVAVGQEMSAFSGMYRLPVADVMWAITTQQGFNSSIDAEIETNPRLAFRKNSSMLGRFSPGERGTVVNSVIRSRGGRTLAMAGFFDNRAIRVVWASSRHYVDRVVIPQRKKQGLPDLSDAERMKLIGDIAAEVVTTTQPVSDPMHVNSAALEAKTSRLMKFFTFFRAQRNQFEAMFLDGAVQWGRGGVLNKLQVAKRITLGAFLSNLMWLMWREFYEAGLRGFEPKEEDYEAELRRVGSRLFQSFGSIFFGAGIPVYLFSKFAFQPDPFAPSIGPGANVFDQFIGRTNQIIQAILDHDDADELLDATLDMWAAAGTILGRPVAAPLRDIRQVIETIKGEGEGSPGAAPGAF